MKPVIIGAGLAGLTVALFLAPMPVILLSAKKLGDESSSAWAQGGIAAAVGADDTAQLHAKDTINAGAGFCDPAIVRQVTEDGAAVVGQLLERGVAFDRDPAGKLSLGLEGAHRRRRIIHVTGDGTGPALMKALVAAVRATPSIEVVENAVATDLIADAAISGVVVERNGERLVIASDCVVLATGGAGALWQHTTNPLGSWGRGLALAARSGAILGDLEFMQFHPTAIDIGRDPMPLASEALRGEGAILIDENGTRFMAGQGKEELEPRDVVARAIWNHIGKGHKVFLDTRAALGENFAERFPSIYAVCRTAGIDPVRQPIPVRPAAHYHMGGVVTDARGRTSMKGLWACGEVACTGLHGANRLASNSLLEAASFGRRVAEDIAGMENRQPVIRKQNLSYEGFVPSDDGRFAEIRAIMSAHVGVLRDEAGLEIAIRQLTPLAQKSDRALVGLMIATAALRREESRGAHARTDYPVVSTQKTQRQLTLADIMRDAEPARAVGT